MELGKGTMTMSAENRKEFLLLLLQCRLGKIFVEYEIGLRELMIYDVLYHCQNSLPTILGDIVELCTC